MTGHWLEMKPRTKTEDCHCPRCRAGRRIERIAATLSKRDGDFIMGMFEAQIELWAQAQMREGAGKN